MRAFLILLLTVGTSVDVLAQDWAQWRGPTRDGAIAAAVLPSTWPAAVSRAWRVEVGEGYSSPLVAGDRVFVHSRRDPEEMLTALDLHTGKVLWQGRYPAPFAKNQYAVRMAKGPNSTPLIVGNTIYTLGVTGLLTAWRTTDGSVVWRNDYSSATDTSKLFCGTAMSPLLEGGAIVVQVGSDVKGGRVLALDPATGKERWAWNGPGPGYASPVALTVGGVRQIVTLTNTSLVGLDAHTGTLLWSTDFADEWHENIVSPTWTGTHLIVSGVRQGTHAYRLSSSGGRWQATQAWKNPEVTMYMSVPVVSGDTIYGLSNKRKGQFVALDAASGKARWMTEGREGDHASVLTSPGHILFLTNAGDLVIARKSATAFSEERRLEVADGETWANPAFVPGGLLVRDAQGVALLRWAP